MADALWQPIFLAPSAVEETFAQLDNLMTREATKRAAERARLEAAVAGLDAATPAATEQPEERPVGRAPRPRQAAAEPVPTPYVNLPERTTHGGPFGPQVRAKLVAEALARREW